MKRLLTSAGAAALMALAAAANADTYTETGDAGELPGTAQHATGGGASLDAILGELAPGEADMFCIRINNPGAFSATTVGLAGFDTQLFLFDANGVGVYANDDSPNGGTLQSLLPAGHANSPIAAGTYFLAISQFDYDPRTGGNLIFNNAPFIGVYGPNLLTPVDGWGGGSGQGGGYAIALTGAGFCQPVPVPGAALLASIGFGTLHRIRRRLS